MKLDATLVVDARRLNEAGKIARAAEAVGFAALWTPETQHNPFLPLTLAADHTAEIELGTAVAIAFARSPMVTAQIAWDLQAFSGGRFILGLGTQVKAHIERRFGMTWDPPVPKIARLYSGAARYLACVSDRRQTRLSRSVLQPYPHVPVLQPWSDCRSAHSHLHRWRQ